MDPQGVEKPKPGTPGGDDALLREVKRRYKLAADASEPQRAESLRALRFCDPDQQWDPAIKAMRTTDQRPCLVVDRITPFVHQIVNDFRQNRQAIRVSPVGDGADQDAAELRQGYIRHIEVSSKADLAYDTAFESMVRCGVGWLRVNTAYVNETSFEQEIQIERVPNMFMVYRDPASQSPDGSDANWGFVQEDMSLDAFRELYPHSKVSDRCSAGATEFFQSIGDQMDGWFVRDEQRVRVVEYFDRVRVPQKLVQLSSGWSGAAEDVDEENLPEGVTVMGRRDSFTHEVRWYKLNGLEVLESTVWPGKWIPLVPVYGDELNINGEVIHSGLVHALEDPQRMVNFGKSAQAEVLNLAPKAPFVGPRGFMGNREKEWQSANRRNLSALEFEVYDSNNRPLPPPQRMNAEAPIQGITEALAGSQEDMKAVTGMYDPSLGTGQNASQSGRAIQSLQHQGQVGTFHFTDNMARSLRQLGLIILDLIPHIIDTPREVRVISDEGQHNMVKVNQRGKEGADVNNMMSGRFDVVVSSGPSYATRRMENLAVLMDLVRAVPGLGGVIGDLLVSQMDTPISKKLQERLQLALPPQLQDSPDGQKPLPPAVQQRMAQGEQMIQRLTQELQSLTQERDQKRMELESKERVAIIQAQAGVLEALIKKEGDASLAVFQAEMDRLNNRWGILEGNQPIGDPPMAAGPSGQPASASGSFAGLGAQPAGSQPSPQPRFDAHPLNLPGAPAPTSPVGA